MRTLNVGGRQGRGNPFTGIGAHNRAPGRPFDLFALAIASHVEQATPGVRLDVCNPASRHVWTWRACWCICAGLALLGRGRLHQADGGESVGA